jgi:hypothetical protein
MSRTQSVKRESATPETPANRDGKVIALSDHQLLYSRSQVRKILGISLGSLVRLESSGHLKPVRLNPEKATAKVFYRRSDVVALAEG